MLLIWISALTLSSLAAAQDDSPPTSYPSLPKVAAKAGDFVAPGWTVVSKAVGDLNGDRHADVALALWPVEASDAEQHDVARQQPYRLVIAFARSKGGYQLIEDNPTFLQPPDLSATNNDPIEPNSLRIFQGALQVSRTYLRGQYHYRFRWMNHAFRLIEYYFSGSDGHCVSETNINFLTRRAKLETEELSENAIDHKAIRKTRARLASLAEAGSDAFYPEQLIIGTQPEC